MLNIKNLKKYYNKGRPNEIRAVDDITLTLEGTGLVVLLGKSGCGKTTLLSCISGLDRTDSGSLAIDNETITRYNAKEWDRIRNKRIGYIFQNYNLINELTVYQNLETALKLAGLANKEEADKRIEYALSLVGMEKFKNRRPDTLSGGQQQRVGIARALVKGADIIIADEPTGNLDDKNTMAVMEILKGVSKHCLVVLVTHEEKLADFYGDRIIRIVDGKVISDTYNQNTESLEHRHADTVYLGDLQKNEYRVGEVDINYFFDIEEKNLALDIVSVEGKLFIKPRYSDGKLNYVTNGSTVKFVEGKYQRKERNDIDISIDNTVLSKIDKPAQSVFKTQKVVYNTFNNYLAMSGVKRKNPYRTLFISTIFLIIIIALTAPSFVFNAKTELTNDRNMLRIEKATMEEVLPYENNASIAKVINRKIENMPLFISNPHSPFNTSAVVYNMSGSIFGYGQSNVAAIPYSAVSEELILKGEVYLDILVYERLSITDEYKALGYLSKDSLIGLNITNLNYDFYYAPPGGEYYGDEYYRGMFNLTIKGFVNRGEPLIYMSDEDFADMIQTDTEGNPYVYVLANNRSAAAKVLKDAGYEVVICQKEQVRMFYLYSLARSLLMLIIVGIIIIVQIISMSKISRSVFVGKIKQLTMLRAIGTPKGDILKGVATENTVIIALTTLRGWLISSIVLLLLQTVSIIVRINFVYYTWWIALIVGAFLYGVSILIAMWSPMILLRKTPSELIAKYDI